MSQRVVRFSQLRDKGIPWSRMHIDRLEKAGKFPRRVRLGPGTVVWVEEEVDALIASALADRNLKAA